jgi:outer membrane protein TolC
MIDQTRTKAAVVAAAVFLIYPLARAETPLTLDRAVSLALQRAPELSAARAGRDSASQKVRQAKSAYLPRVRFGASYLAWWPKNELPIDLSSLPLPVAPEIGDIDDVHHVRAGLEVGIRALDFSRGSRVDAARQTVSAADARIQEARAGLAFRVRATFLAALYSRDMQNLGAESLKIARAHEKRAKVRAEVGTGSQLALAQARVRVAKLEAQHRKARSELQRYRRQLASLLGRREVGKLQGDLHALAQARAAKPMRSPRAARAVAASANNEALARQPTNASVGKQHPALQRIHATREAARLSARSRSRTFLPSVDLFGKVDVEYPHVMKTEWGPRFQGGINLTWDLYDGGLRGGQVREAEARSRQLRALSRATEENLRRELIDLAARRRTALAELESAERILKQTRIYLKVARAAVAAGTGTDLDVHQAELGLDQARIGVRKALLDLALVSAETLKVQGISQPGETS